ncbi:MAG: hypothetical protein MJ252_09305 [archaeon]|nr:hypothetical protein [archaeon]
MEENPSGPQELFPCPVCHRKFLKDRLEVHLRSCDKSNKFAHGNRGGYDNSEWMKRLDAEMEKEAKGSTYKTSKKDKVDPNKAFMDRLDKEMEKEAKGSTYKPSQPKKKESQDESDPNKAFMDRLDQEMAREEQNPSYKKTQPKKKVNKEEENQNDFLSRVEKEMEKDKANPYVPYAEQKKKLGKEKPANQSGKDDFASRVEKEMEKDKANPYVPYSEQKKKMAKDKPITSNKDDFASRVENEMKKEDTYKPSDKSKKGVQGGRGNYSKKEFEDRIKSEMEKEKGDSKGNNQLICYLCQKLFPTSSYVSHLNKCKAAWQRNNIGKDIEALKPEGLDDVIKHPSTLTSEQIEKFNNGIKENKDKMVFVPCENCARNILLCKMEEHLKTCKPMSHGMRPKKDEGVAGFEANLDKMMKESPEGQIELVPCEKCGRKLAADRLEAHKRACKGRK